MIEPVSNDNNKKSTEKDEILEIYAKIFSVKFKFFDSVGLKYKLQKKRLIEI